MTTNGSAMAPELPQVAVEQALSSNAADEALVPSVASLAAFVPREAFVGQIPIAFARQHNVLGLTDSSGRLRLAMANAASWHQLDIVGRILGHFAYPVFAPAEVISSAINRAYEGQSGQAQSLINGLDRSEVLDEIAGLSQREDLLDTSGKAPVVRLVNLVLFEAVKIGASDVHIQPAEQKLAVRYRCDGVLFDAFELPKGLQEGIVGRIKVLGRMNVAEKRLAQDGRATAQIGEKQVDLRIASLPTSDGERVVIRLLDKSARLYRLTELGMGGATLSRFKQLVAMEHGIVLVTGPTGSGKSTTLYAALKEIDTAQHNVLTLEDPIEYRLEGISQTQVSDKKGMTFASALRSVLRQDPDVIMVGEIRDRETAAMAIQSALTGHLVFSTLHTNDAPSAVTRLLDLGVEPYLVASSVVGVLAQRLVRQVCKHCRQMEAATEKQRQILLEAPEYQQQIDPVAPLMLASGKGCSHCRQTGYRGRMGIFELLMVDDAVRSQIQARATAAQVKSAAKSLRTLRQDGLNKVLHGVTTIEEIQRVTTTALEEKELPETEPLAMPEVIELTKPH
jgi:general secretion pathway protein E